MAKHKSAHEERRLVRMMSVRVIQSPDLESARHRATNVFNWLAAQEDEDWQ